MNRVLFFAGTGLLSLLFLPSASAQDTDALGTYTPYSLYGIGDLVPQGGAYNRSMGGTGIGLRNNRFINWLNPAAVTARDTLSFMLDFGAVQSNHYADDGRTSSAYNTFSMNNFVFTAPIYRSSALVVGVAPYSSIGYKFESVETDDDIVAEMGDIRYQKYGTGTVNQLFAGAAVTLFDRLSLGAQLVYYFGALNRYSNVLFNSSSSYRTLYTGWDYSIHSVSGNFGLQYEQPVGKEKNSSVTVGLTYRMGTRLNGLMTRYALGTTVSSVTDTVLFQTSNTGLTVPAELGAGISFKRNDRWSVGFDYTRQDWRNIGFNTPGIDFTPMTAQAFRLGFELTPNRYDVRYYAKRITYRAGAYYEQSYVGIGGLQVDAVGVTVGLTLPIYRWYNAFTVGVDAGQRGTVDRNMVKERYLKFFFSVNLHDIWFQKYRYE